MNTNDLTNRGASVPERPRRDWWGDFDLPEGVWGYWRIGPLRLWVCRTEHEWCVAQLREGSPLTDECELVLPAGLDTMPIPPEAERHRVAFGQAPNGLRLLPLLADRPVVARPETPISIPAREQVSVYVSSAAWVGLDCGRQRYRLLEVPAWRSTDTWFGDNRSGFLCYATRTMMRLTAKELPQRPHRVVTQVEIDNQGNDTLKIERLSLPVTSLSVFVSSAGALWTERLQLTREGDAELANVHIDHEVPPAPGARKLSEARQSITDNFLTRVFTGLFG